MTKSRLTTAVGAPLDRSFSLRVAGDLGQMLEASGVVDQFMATDQMGSMWPMHLWTPENTAIAETMTDPDSFHDAFQVAGFAAAATRELGVAITADSIRRGPAELMQTMLSLATATEKPATLLVGAGEVKNTKPLGYKRSQGIARLEDLFEIVDRLWKADRPFDFDGNVTTLRQAWVGGIKPKKPQFFALGGGPRLIDVATKYADGFVAAVPCTVPNPEVWGAKVKDMKQKIEQGGRDPEAFEFGVMAITLLHEDPEAINRAIKNPLVRWLAATSGRMDMSDWEREGIETVRPPGWHYALKHTPTQMGIEEIESVMNAVPDEMVRKGYITGSPADVSKQLEPYIDAGATWLTFFDVMPLDLSLEESVSAAARSIEVCRLAKEYVA